MGGYGSTRWSGHRTRRDTDPLLWLDVRLLARRGALVPGVWSTTAWTCGGKPSGNITHWVADDHLVLDYKVKGPLDRDWIPVREQIPLEHTACNYGGTRPWFRCPGCDRRRAVLHSVGGHFRCRECHQLVYSSTRDDALERLHRKGEKVTRRLGAPTTWVLNWSIIPPDKPLHMHWDTYEALCTEWRAIRDAAWRANDVSFELLMARTEKLLQQWGG